MKHIPINSDGCIAAIIWEKFRENVLILGTGGQITRHEQSADKQTIKQTLLPVNGKI